MSQKPIFKLKDWLKDLLDYLDWNELSKNPFIFDYLDWDEPSKNPFIFELDYEAMADNFEPLSRELNDYLCDRPHLLPKEYGI